ncbi:MAG: hypothetical protein ACJ764_06840 [Solirubrobacteraceae bacterium]
MGREGLERASRRLLALSGALLACALATAGPAGAAAFKWSGPVTLDGLQAASGNFLSAIDCPSSSLCVAVDRVGNVVTFNPASPPDPTAVGLINTFGDPALTAVSCFSTTQCTAVGDAGQEVTFNPSSVGHPTPVTVDGNALLLGVSCPSSTECLAVGTAGDAVTFDPTTGAVITGPKSILGLNNSLDSASCVSDTLCVAGSAGGTASIFDPNDLDNVSTLGLGIPAAAVVCLSSDLCTAAGGNQAIAFNTSGTVVGAANTIDGNSDIIDGLSCVSTTSCTAVDEQGNAVSYNPSVSPVAVTHAAVSVDGVAELPAVHCLASSTTCIAVDPFGQAVVFDSSSPTVPGPTTFFVDPKNYLLTLACPSSTQCTAMDVGSGEVTFNPAAPGSPTPVPVDFGAQVDDGACASVSLCVVLEDNGTLVSFDPTTGNSLDTNSSLSQGFLAATCASGTLCAAVGFNGDEVAFDPTSLSGATETQVGSANFQAVSCPSTSQCTAVDIEGRQVTFDPAGGSFTNSASLEFLVALNAVACPSTTECIAVDGMGQELTFNPLTNDAPSLHDIDGSHRLDAIACPSSTECVTVDSVGTQVTFNPASPAGASMRALVTTGLNQLNAVVCLSVAQCVTVNQVGQAFFGLTPPVSTGAPRITGRPRVGSTLTEHHGKWVGLPTSFTYHWQRCNSSGGACVAIGAATKATYKLTTADQGHRIRVQETAHNSSGPAHPPATSGPTALIAPPPPISVTTRSPSRVRRTSALLHGLIGTKGQAVHWRFQYGLTRQYGKHTPVKIIAAGRGQVSVSAGVAALKPGTLYHFRLVATRPNGVTNGRDLTFRTPVR